MDDSAVMEGVSPPAHRGDPDLTRLRQAVDASGEIMVMTDRDGAFTFVNPAADDELRVQLASEREQAYAGCCRSGTGRSALWTPPT